MSKATKLPKTEWIVVIPATSQDDAEFMRDTLHGQAWSFMWTAIAMNAEKQKEKR